MKKFNTVIKFLDHIYLPTSVSLTRKYYISHCDYYTEHFTAIFCISDSEFHATCNSWGLRDGCKDKIYEVEGIVYLLSSWFGILRLDPV